MADLIQRFDEERNAYEGISAKRRRIGLTVLRRFEEHIGIPLEQAGARELQSYLETRVAASLSPGTVRRELYMIRPLFVWMKGQGMIDRDTLRDVKDVTPPRGSRESRPNPYKRAEIQQFWREFEEKYPPHPELEKYLKRWRGGSSKYRRIAPHAVRLQARAIFTLALFGGLRMVEIYNLDLRELDPDHDDYLPVMGAKKNGDGKSRARPVPYTEPLRVAVREWVAFRAELAPEHAFVWLSLAYEPSARNPMRWRRFEMLAHDLGSGWEFRRMRHTYATEMLRAGMPIALVQRSMGHHSIEQTLAYAKILPDDVVREAAVAEAGFVRSLSG